MARILRLAMLAVLVTAAACGDPGPALQAPVAPSENDPAYEVGGLQGWYLIGNDLTAGQDTLTVTVQAPEGTATVDLWVGPMPGVRLEHNGDGFAGTVDIAGLAQGDWDVVLAANGAETAFARHLVHRSHPLYVIMSTDWDDADNTDESLALQEQLHLDHPELLLTHFVGPYTFTDPALTPERVATLAAWVRGMRDEYGDEIGLHIHPYCSFVEEAGVTCRHQPSVVYDRPDTSGYTVIFSSYTEAEQQTLFEKADELFLANGLGKPTSFRAGGWTAELSTMRALAAAGYLVDTSANNWARMEEWWGQSNGELYAWNRSHWASIDDTSQPYYPSESDILSGAAPNLPLLQVPDNGSLVDYVSGQEMIEIFESNWPTGRALLQPVAYSIGYHPSNFSPAYKDRLDEALDHLELHLASQQAGPVVFETLSNMPRVWIR